MEIVYQIGGALLALFFIFLTYMSTKTWRWLHVTAMFLVFVASAAFCVYAAMTLKTRAAWLKLNDNLEKQVATVEEDLARTTRGDPNDVEAKTPSVFSVREALGRTIIDRGRVWRECAGAARGGTPELPLVTIQTSPPPDPNNPSPGPPKKNNIQPKTILHVFREAPTAEGSPAVPAAYVGEFRVMQATDNAVQLEPTMKLSVEQQALARAAGPTWALYEVCPVDGHEFITGDEKQRTDPLVFAARIGAPQMTPAAGQKMLQPFLRDGGPAQDSDPPENVWYEVKFTKEYEVSVDAPVVNSLDADPFNTEGQAVLERLRRHGGTPEEGGKVKFGPADGQIHTAVLDQQTAQKLIDDGYCTLERKIYRRSLTDFEREFHSINERLTELNDRMRQLSLDKKAMEDATAKAEQQRGLIEELKSKAGEDLAKATYELQQLTKYEQALSSQLAAVQTELSQLYLSNKAIAQELAKLTVELTEQIDRRTREATARVP
jgi:hypothetical protein